MNFLEIGGVIFFAGIGIVILLALSIIIYGFWEKWDSKRPSRAWRERYNAEQRRKQ